VLQYAVLLVLSFIVQVAVATLAFTFHKQVPAYCQYQYNKLIIVVVVLMILLLIIIAVEIIGVFNSSAHLMNYLAIIRQLGKAMWKVQLLFQRCFDDGAAFQC